MIGTKIKAKIKVDTVRFFNEESSFGIITFTVKDYLEDNETWGTPSGSVAKGKMIEPIKGGEYYLEGVEVCDPKWGNQYNIEKMYSSLFLDKNDKSAQRTFLECLFTEKQVEEMYKALDDPYKTMLDGNAAELIKIKGCGMVTAAEWIRRFNDNIERSKLCADLAEYHFSASMMNRLLKHFGTPDLVIKAVKNNPYSLIDVDGIGWKKCDAIAQVGGLSPQCPDRIVAFLKYWLNDQARMGRTYVLANEQMLPAILEITGKDIPDEPILEALKQMDNLIEWSEDRTALGLKHYMNLEKNIAQRLIELRDAPNEFVYDNWLEIIKKKEVEQGWNYTQQQLDGIKAALNNQVVIITGGAGTGKTSVVAGMLAVLSKYKFAQCALSGRAAARMSEVTHVDGYTIHRLLGYPSYDSSNPCAPYAYGLENPLNYQIIIIDEISMVDGELFWALLKAIKPGTKLILLGDVGQLESIGCSNIANDLIESPEITSVLLDKIHRQAASSAIITESISIRQGIQTIPKDWVGVETRGELQDLTYECYSDSNNTFYRILEQAQKLYDNGIPSWETQVIVPIKERQSGTWMLNLGLQEIYNPNSDKQLLVSYDNGKSSYIRTGDKVINIKNNYQSREYVGQWQCFENTDTMGSVCPVFNGNMGIVLDINVERQEMIVDYMGIGKVLVTKNMLSNTMLGYAVTVHKCQGSEFPHVIFGVDFSSYSLLTRQLIYTALTRASKHCYVIAQTGALRYATSQNSVSVKQTILQSVLDEIAHPKF